MNLSEKTVKLATPYETPDSISFWKKLSFTARLFFQRNPEFLPLDEQSKKELEASLEKDYERIKGFEYIHSLGLEIEENPNVFLIKRSSQSRKLDIISLALGIVLMLFTVPGVIMFNQALSKVLLTVTDLIPGFALIAVGVTGFSLALKNFNRLFHFHQFSLILTHYGKELTYTKDSKTTSRKLGDNAELVYEGKLKTGSLLIRDEDFEWEIVKISRNSPEKQITAERLIRLFNESETD